MSGKNLQAVAVTFAAAFKFSPNGRDIVEYAAGDVCDVSPRCAEVAAQAGVLVEPEQEPKSPPRRGRKSKDPTPENKAADPVDEDKVTGDPATGDGNAAPGDGTGTDGAA